MAETPEGPYKPIRKSAYMSFLKCAKQFSFLYNSPKYWDYQQKDHKRKSTALGDIFHGYCDEFFDKLNLETLYHLNDEQLYNTMRTNFPTNTEIDSWFDYFVRVEVAHFKDIKEKYGWDGIDKWYKPALLEAKLEMEDEIGRTGHVDRVDYFPEENCYCVVEYKTGKSYNRDKKWVMTSIRKETGFYAVILNNTKTLDAPVRYFALLNPSTEQLTVEKFHHSTLISVNNKYKDLVSRIKNDGPWPRNISPLCKWCDFKMECFYPDKKEPNDYIFGRMEEKHDSK